MPVTQSSQRLLYPYPPADECDNNLRFEAYTAVKKLGKDKISSFGTAKYIVGRTEEEQPNYY